MTRRPLRRPALLASLSAGAAGGFALALGGYLVAAQPTAPVPAAAQVVPSPAARKSTEAGPTGGGTSSSATPTTGTTGTPATRRSAAAATVVVKGPAVQTKYGTVQVQFVKTGNRITSVTPLTLPSGGHSDEVTAKAAPVLKQETLAAQSADIDTVSGASYTSDGWRRSLQGALDAARARA
ncbi:MAG: FMN-binding protein [Frankia sp.]